jgi:hypothetical protein
MNNLQALQSTEPLERRSKDGVWRAHPKNAGLNFQRYEYREKPKEQVIHWLPYEESLKEDALNTHNTTVLIRFSSGKISAVWGESFVWLPSITHIALIPYNEFNK